MSGAAYIDIERRTPSRREAFTFRSKTLLFQARRTIEDAFLVRVNRFHIGSSLADAAVIARSVTPLWTESDPREKILVAGKIQNLRIAIRNLNGVEIPAGEVFSFWKHVGRATRLRGFVAGRELREGCIIPNLGGGLCQLSNALYDAALQAGFDIVERHGHTRIVSGSLAEIGRDATVFWNYVDLRFRSDEPFHIQARLFQDELRVEFKSERRSGKTLHQIRRYQPDKGVNSCATCEAGDCHRVMKRSSNVEFGRTAFLVDEFSPEFDEYIQDQRTDRDLLCIPIDGKRYKRPNYSWRSDGFARVFQSPFATALRSYRSRKLASQGAARQLGLLAMYKKIAQSYSRRLTVDVLHISVHQNLLPFLWESGQLGGRSFDVLMTALPMAELQKRLDVAKSLHPESTTLGDFRADSELVAVESEALRNARRIVTQHTDIASLFHERALLLNWRMDVRPSRTRRKNAKPTILFPSSTVGRKGCYELRDAVSGLDVRLVTMGPYIENTGFWDGFEVERAGEEWLNGTDLVVLPAFVEHRPRRLLMAAGAGIPVIASEACGVSFAPNVTTIPSGDAKRLREAILEHIAL